MDWTPESWAEYWGNIYDEQSKDWVQLDNDHRYKFWSYGEGEETAGFRIAHRNPGAPWCMGAVEFTSERRPNGWDLHSREPLDVSPSILCGSCGHHGFVRDGKWVGA